MRLAPHHNAKTTGAVAAELALLVAFVYVPLSIGAIYIGWLAVARGQVHQANHYAIYAEGDQSEALQERGQVTDEFFPEFTGNVSVEEGDAEEPDIPGDNELRDLFNAFTEPIHYRNVSAHGSFHLVGGRVVYRESINVSEGWRIRPEGQLVNSWRLLDDNIPEDLTRYLQDYLRRRAARSVYEHSWVHDDLDVVAGDEDVGPWNLEVPSDTATQDQWHPEAAVRWDKTRMVGDQQPPAAEQRAWIGTPSIFPDPQPTDDYWHPCEGPDTGGTDPGGQP
jgi:hypothetical protein